MSDPHGPQGPQNPDQTPDQTPGQVPALHSGRRASVTLRRDADDRHDLADAMDPAFQATAGALRLTYIALLAIIVGMFAYYLGSGFNEVREGERGIRLVFGKVTGRDLPPGLHWAPPYPFGDVIKVQTGTISARMDDEFWPAMSDRDREQSLERMFGRDRLAPDMDGSLITGDQALAHAQLRVVYLRESPTQYAENMTPGHEQSFVLAAVRRGMVRATAETTIDDFLGGQTEAATVAERAQAFAQELLTASGTGLRIDRLQIVQRTAPLFVRSSFEQVQQAEAERGARIEAARAERNRRLNRAAGAAAPVLLELIGRYERALELGLAEEAEELMARIEDVLQGRPVQVNGREFGALVAGDVTRIINEGRAYRASVVNRRQAEAQSFAAKRTLFEASPAVLLHSEWGRAIEQFYGKSAVQVMYVPGKTSRMTLHMNPDPEHQRAAERERREREMLRRQEERRRTIQDRELRTDTETRIYSADPD